GLVAPGLHPLVVRGDALLSAGQFSDAAKAYSEAILLSPTDYLLFYMRATASSPRERAGRLRQGSRID
ncbi:hypothetical protein M405DRAFT_920017, partial [Rhizopogon salebrosus TDB-379]